jgi:hypothetical protein
VSADHFSFVAQQIGALKADGCVAPLTSETNATIELSLPTSDVTVREI